MRKDYNPTEGGGVPAGTNNPTEQGTLLDWGIGKRQPINNLGGAEPDQTPILERSGGT